MQAEKMPAPPSGRSSRLTEVMTQYFRPMRLTVDASRKGSPRSRVPGRPVVTAQYAQARVQMSPRIMKVAADRSQHSPMFGQWASSHTVCNWLSRMSCFSSM